MNAAKRNIVLASTSAIRATILTQAGIPFSARRPELDETAEKERTGPLSPADLALHLARAKALSCMADREELVIGSDQVLEFDGQCLDKVDNMAAARARLWAMRGKTHYLVGGTALVLQGQVLWEDRVRSTLIMRDFSEAELDAYLAKTGPRILASVACYELEREGITLFESLHGDQFAMMGLHLRPLLRALRQFGGL